MSGVELIVAGWFVSAVISKLVASLPAYFKNQKEWQTGLKDDMDRLNCRLPQIESVVFAVEKTQIADKNPRLKDWLCQLKDALCEADDVLDELEYIRTRDEVRSKKRKVPECSSSFAGKVSRMLASSSAPVKKMVERAINKDGTLLRLKDVVKKLDGNFADVGPFLNCVGMEHTSVGNSGSSSSHNVDRSSGPVLNVTTPIVGREEEKKKLLSQLGCFSSSDPDVNKGVSVIAVVGEGGIGKTTLAQLICEDVEVKKHFKEKNIWWVTVSDDFDVNLLTKKIYQAAVTLEPSVDNPDVIQKQVTEKVASTIFLLVLDDVWNEDEGSWSRFISPILRYGKPGSKILVTTRSKIVAQLVNSTSAPICLNRLEEGEYWEMFKKICLPDREQQEEYPELLAIGRKIAKKLNGLPLSAKIIGRTLNKKLEEKHWSDIYENIRSNANENIMSILKLSYTHLPPYLQPLFRFCSLFPRDHEFLEGKLVFMWVGAGLVRQENGKEQDLEELGYSHFEELFKRSIFNAKTGYNICGPTYVMHDMLHDLARNVSIGECYRLSGNKMEHILPTTQHLSVVTQKMDNLKDVSHIKHLRTLHLSCDSSNRDENNEALCKMFESLTSIRVLDLSCTPMVEQSKCFDNLIHLRYLDAKVATSSVGNLHLLQFLAVYPSANPREELEGVPESEKMGCVSAESCNLPRLRHLMGEFYFSSDISRPFDVLGLGNLTSLRKFQFVLKKREGHRISELRNLVELRTLQIGCLETISSFEEASKANMEEKQSLKEIELRWGIGKWIKFLYRNAWESGYLNAWKEGYDDEWEQKYSMAEQVFDLLKPHVGLQKMFVFNYPGSRSPRWLEKNILFKLEVVHIDQCYFWKDMSFLQRLPFLRELTINSMSSLETIGTTQVSYDCPSFPKLRILEIICCKKLTTLPPLPLELKELYLLSVSLSTLPGWRESKTSSSSWLSTLHILSLPDISSLQEGLLQDNGKLKHLRELKLKRCENLVHFPFDSIGELTSLKKLSLKKCQRLVVPPEARYPASLRVLHILECCPQLVTPTTDDDGADQGSSRSCLDDIRIDDPLLLVHGPSLKHLTSTRSLDIRDCSRLESLTVLEPWLSQNRSSLQRLKLRNVPSLESLPPSIEFLTSLLELELIHASALEALPKLPESLVELAIYGCTFDFADWYDEDEGPGWCEIRHIRDVIIEPGESKIGKTFILSEEDVVLVG